MKVKVTNNHPTASRVIYDAKHHPVEIMPGATRSVDVDLGYVRCLINRPHETPIQFHLSEEQAAQVNDPFTPADDVDGWENLPWKDQLRLAKKVAPAGQRVASKNDVRDVMEAHRAKE